MSLIEAPVCPALEPRVAVAAPHRAGLFAAQDSSCAPPNPFLHSAFFLLPLLRQLEVNGLTQDVEEQFLAFLNARSGGARHHQVKRGNTFGEAAVAPQETKALHLLPVGLLQCSQHVAGLAAGGECDQKVAALAQTPRSEERRVGKECRS